MKTLSVASFVFVFLPVTAPLLAAVDYGKSIKPLLHDRCYACHGALKQKGKLRLDTVELMLKGGQSGAVIERGKPEKSLLVERVINPDIAERMPPQHEGEPLTAEQVTLLREWIAAGAPAMAGEKAETDPKEHWAFRPRLRPSVPVINSQWVRNPIDAFVAKQHKERGLTPQPQAPRSVLLRRLYIDLIGLPPAPADITAFENDTSPDWYDKVVKRLLDDKRHGERWARHWMDIWRYSDWWGLGDQMRNSQKHMWHWRDWIMESLNSDVPYDEMVREMLAADELYPNDLQKLRATGFLSRNWFLFNRHQWMEETVEHVSKGFLGITMNCARCHDHKYDPIAQTDYYKMRAFFEPYQVRMDMVAGESDLSRDGIPRAFDGQLDTPTYRFVRGDERNPDKSVVISPGVPAIFAFKTLDIQPVSLPLAAWQPERRPWVLDALLAAARQKVEGAASSLATAKEKLASAQKRETETTDLAAAVTAAVSAAKGEVNLAELSLAVANAELVSLKKRSAAMSAKWAGANDQREQVKAAVQVEREVVVAKALLAMTHAELRLSSAAKDQKDACEKELKTAREALDKARNTAAATVSDADAFTPFEGAKWSPTRFVSSDNDDPAIKFGPQSSGRRAALADWITDPRNPLTARVAVNHLWSRHMGTPLVPDTFEFGRKNPEPANPELIDWLASELIKNGWSMKHLHRLIVTSATYRLSSSAAGGQANLAKEPDNRHWWRRASVRIESQAVRDCILALAEELDPTLGGPSVPLANQSDSKRRSLYFFHSNNERNLFLTTFDEASVKECYRRDQSIVPQQALALSNSRLVLDAAKRIAARFGATLAPNDDAGFVRQAFLGVLGTRPSEAETAACVKTLEAWRKLPDTTPEQARANLVWALLNHNDFVTLR